MSAQFLIEYAGMPMRFNGKTAISCTETEATPFVAEADAWWAAFNAQLNPDRCRVVDIDARNQMEANR
jgi:hypothetical protein